MRGADVEQAQFLDAALIFGRVLGQANLLAGPVFGRFGRIVDRREFRLAVPAQISPIFWSEIPVGSAAARGLSQATSKAVNVSANATCPAASYRVRFMIQPRVMISAASGMCCAN